MKQFMRLKFFEKSGKERTTDFELAEQWIKDGSDVHAFMSNQEGESLVTSKIISIDKSKSEIETMSRHIYKIYELDDQKRNVLIKKFLDIGTMEETTDLEKLETWIRRPEYIVIAYVIVNGNQEYETSQIQEINLENKTFTTYSGSVYYIMDIA